MTIAGFDDEALTSVLRENLTPSDFIRTPERLFGRDKHLRTIERALNSAGRQIFIYGDRGVGKTSLALTAAYLHTHSGHRPIHVNCGRTVGFFPVLRAVGNAVLPPQAIFEHQASRANLGFNFAGLGANFSPSAEVVRSVAEPTNLNEAFDIIRYVEQRVASKTTVIVIDEMERIQDAEEKDKFAEFIKNVSTVTEKLKFIFCGIGADLTELLGAHPSAGRILEPIELKSISHDSLWKIIQTPAEKLGIQVDRDKLIRIGQISDGFPHYVHLVGESLFWTISDDSKPIFEANEEHYRSAIRGALARTEAMLRDQFLVATRKTKNTDDYEEALWALADKTSDRRQLTDICDTSYRNIMAKRPNRQKLSKENLNQRLLSLKKSPMEKLL